MDTERPRGQIRHDLLALVVVASLFGACTVSPEAIPGAATPSGTSPSANAPATIPQPSVPGDLPLAPERERIDTTMPTFSDPTNITNPLFPISRQESVVLLGHVDGQPFRTEVTLLPETRIIGWNGQQVEVAVRNTTLVEPLLETAIDTLDAAVDARSPARARDAAIEAARLGFDLQLRYRPVTEIDLARRDPGRRDRRGACRGGRGCRSAPGDPRGPGTLS